MSNYKFLFLAILLTALFCRGQINTYSPYSYFGYGVLHNTTNTHNISMGGLGLSVVENQYLNYLNPASYSFLSKTSFEFGMKSSFIKMSQNDLNQKNFISGLSSIGLGFPISKRIGISFGLQPYSSVGYDLKTEDIISVNNVEGVAQSTYNYRGSGGLNKLLFGFSWKVKDGTSSTISLGTNFNYLFGSIERETIIFSDNSPIYFRDKDDKIIHGLNLEFGLLYSLLINTEKSDNFRLNGGIKILPSTSMQSDRSVLQTTYIGPVYHADHADIIFQETDIQDNISFPWAYSIGFSLHDYEKWLIGIDYNAHASFIDDQEINISSDIMRNRKEYILGGFFIPNKDDIYTYFNTVKYRFGVSYASGYLDIGSIANNSSEKLKDISVSCGMGLPIKKSLSIANIGFKYGVIGDDSRTNYIKENYFSIYFSMTLNEKWFNKRKIQ